MNARQDTRKCDFLFWAAPVSSGGPSWTPSAVATTSFSRGLSGQPRPGAGEAASLDRPVEEFARMPGIGLDPGREQQILAMM
jgi:hypothetical protein